MFPVKIVNPITRGGIGILTEQEAGQTFNLNLLMVTFFQIRLLVLTDLVEVLMPTTPAPP